ncbi:UNVERIFIED_CONTAM: Cinnamoyl-CoA reductase 1 [Sesamum calycinum]|uniref:Dihydroflavonol 4-reductase n=1 Tax=Sesamum calycinum TaxID=2727403 RepID=A0AAW2SB89_9LAMI
MKTVCVTGASGYIASWLVKFLLQRGYTVKASVRDPNDPKKTEHLLALEGAKERLHLIKANLLEEGSFDAVVDGCDGVFHTASAAYFVTTDPQADLIDPALKGTLNVLASCAKTPSIKRVVLTSSLVAVIFNGKPQTPEVVVDETWWSDPEFCKQMQPTLNTSSASILNLINGAKTYPNVTAGWVNVKDVANAHILAFENPSANGRYCVVESVVHYSDVVNILRELYPNLQLPEECADDKPFMPTYQVSKERAKSLGVEFTPLTESLKETVKNLLKLHQLFKCPLLCCGLYSMVWNKILYTECYCIYCLLSLNGKEGYVTCDFLGKDIVDMQKNKSFDAAADNEAKISPKESIHSCWNSPLQGDSSISATVKEESLLLVVELEHLLLCSISIRISDEKNGSFNSSTADGLKEAGNKHFSIISFTSGSFTFPRAAGLIADITFLKICAGFVHSE